MKVHVLQQASNVNIEVTNEMLFHRVQAGDIVVYSSLTSHETREWAKATACNFNCFVIIGYFAPTILRSLAIGFDTKGNQVVSCKERLGNDVYLKKTKRSEFNVAIGLPRDSSLSFCQHVLDGGSNFVILIKREHSPAGNQFQKHSAHEKVANVDLETLSQWLTFIEPLVKSRRQYHIDVVFANPVGTKSKLTYSGTSAVLRIHCGNIYLLKILPQTKIDVLSVNIKDSPKLKLIRGKTGFPLFVPLHCQLNYFGQPSAPLLTSTAFFHKARNTALADTLALR